MTGRHSADSDSNVDRESERDAVADALRARESLRGDPQPGDEDLTSQGLTSGLRFGTSDEQPDAAEDALDDDDVEQSGDER